MSPLGINLYFSPTSLWPKRIFHRILFFYLRPTIATSFCKMWMRCGKGKKKPSKSSNVLRLEFVTRKVLHVISTPSISHNQFPWVIYGRIKNIWVKEKKIELNSNLSISTWAFFSMCVYFLELNTCGQATPFGKVNHEWYSGGHEVCVFTRKFQCSPWTYDKSGWIARFLDILKARAIVTISLKLQKLYYRDITTVYTMHRQRC